MPVNITVVDKDGNEWMAGSPTELTDLLSQGYRIKGHGSAADDTALTSGPERPTNKPSNVANPAPTNLAGQTLPAGDGSSPK